MSFLLPDTSPPATATHSLPGRRARGACRGSAPGAIRRGPRSGFTFIELMLSMSITAMTIMVLGGLILAVQTGRQQVEGEQETLAQGTAAIERIRFMVGHAGTYRVSGQPTMLGVKVIPRPTATTPLPEMLVVWSGGRNGGQAALGELTRLPNIAELIVYAPASGNPSQLIEYAFPAFSGTADFRSPSFDTTLRGLVLSPMAEQVELCDRMKWGSTTSSSANASYGEWATGQTGSCIRFQWIERPNSASLAATSPGTAAWANLPWALGSSSSNSGLRESELQIELVLWTRVVALPQGVAAPSGGARASSESIAAADTLRSRLPSIPFFGSVSRRNVYTP